MSADIVTPPQFAAKMDADRLADLKAKGLLVKDACPIDDLELPEPQYGDEIIGTLTPEEAELYVSVFLLSERIDELNRQGASEVLIGMGEAVREKKEADIFENQNQFVTAEFAIEFFKTGRKLDYLKGLFFWTVSERLDCFDHVIGIRSKRRIVRNRRRW